MDNFADFPRKKKKTIDPAALAAHRVRLQNLVDAKCSISHIEMGVIYSCSLLGLELFDTF